MKNTKEFIKMETAFKTDGSIQVGVQASACSGASGLKARQANA
jgi:hypothetical protein